MRHPLRKIINKAGIDLHRYHPEVSKLDWLKSQNIKSVLDIGANIGQFALEIREELPGARIYSFEPIRECYGTLLRTMADDRRFKAFNIALGDAKSSMIMNKSSYTPSSSLRRMADSHKKLFPHTKETVPEKVEIERLDDVFERLNPALEILIKVDTQGYEDKVIAGGMNAFRKAKVVLIEASFIRLYEGQPLFDDIYAKLKSLGLSYRGALREKVGQNGEVIFEDAIFVRG